MREKSLFESTQLTPLAELLRPLTHAYTLLEPGCARSLRPSLGQTTVDFPVESLLPLITD